MLPAGSQVQAPTAAPRYVHSQGGVGLQILQLKRILPGEAEETSFPGSLCWALEQRLAAMREMLLVLAAISSEDSRLSGAATASAGDFFPCKSREAGDCSLGVSFPAASPAGFC